MLLIWSNCAFLGANVKLPAGWRGDESFYNVVLYRQFTWG